MVIFSYDTYQFWAAGQVARAGGNPYLVDAIFPVMVANGWPAEEHIFGFLHPFWSIWIFCALSLLPFEAARVVWLSSVLLLSFVSVRMARRAEFRAVFDLSAPPPFLLFATALFPPFMSAFYNGQTSAVLLLGVVLWLHFAIRGQLLWSGLVLSLTSLKFQLFAPLYLYVALSQAKQREFRFVGGLVLGVLLQAALSLACAPSAAEFWLVATRQMATAAAYLPTASLTRVVADTVGYPQVQIYLMVMVLVGVAVMAWRSQGDMLQKAACIILPVSLVASPYMWTHGFLPLLPLHLAMVSRLYSRSQRWTLYALVALAIFGVVELVAPFDLAIYMALLPLGLLAFGIGTCRAGGLSHGRYSAEAS
jgi:hypothetical protein